MAAEALRDRTKQVRVGERTVKGYSRESLHDAWLRYLCVSPLERETSETSETAGTGAACAHCGKPGADADATDGARSARVHRACFDAWFEAESPQRAIWSLVLVPSAGGMTRLLDRHRSEPRPGAAGSLSNAFWLLGTLLMERGMLRGIRARAERTQLRRRPGLLNRCPLICAQALLTTRHHVIVDPIAEGRHQQQSQHRDSADSVDQHVEPRGGLTTAVRSDPIRNQDDEAKDRRNNRQHLADQCAFVNKPQVAMVKPAIVAIAMTFVTSR